ncbi:MAG: phosphoribosylaminoimidazolesuccinocarboxamide synthase [candidate division WOR-3 bacterium]
MGSVKDLKILREPTENETGLGRFVFSDRYSVFDWGEMPDRIEDKGKAICVVAAYFFETLESYGINSHYLGIVENGKPKKISEINEPSNEMEFRLVRVVRPELKNDGYDYAIFKNLNSNFLIPLEVIYRNSVPEGSSLLKRLRSGEAKPGDFGLQSIPEPNTRLSKPILDFSTKLESTDRYISEVEAREICGLTDEEFESLKNITLHINRIISETAEKLGLYNEDGKFEFALDEDRNLILVDVLGTLDECRFTYEGIPMSKEILRIFYRNTEWYKEIEKAKREDRINWRQLVNLEPPRLPEEWKNVVSNLYRSYANEVTGKRFFSAPPLREVLSEIKRLLKDLS